MIAKDYNTPEEMVRRMENIVDILHNPTLEDKYRVALQRELRELKAKLKETASFQMIWLPESRTLLFKENGRLKGGISGPMAEKKYQKIKEFIKVTIKKSEHV